MANRLPPSQRPERNKENAIPRRWVKLGVVPGNPSMVSVCLGQGPENKPDSRVVVAPDEARTLAAKESDPIVRDALLRFASDIPRVVSELNQKNAGSGRKTAIKSPTVVGPHALRGWCERQSNGAFTEAESKARPRHPRAVPENSVAAVSRCRRSPRPWASVVGQRCVTWLRHQRPEPRESSNLARKRVQARQPSISRRTDGEPIFQFFFRYYSRAKTSSWERLPSRTSTRSST